MLVYFIIWSGLILSYLNVSCPIVQWWPCLVVYVYASAPSVAPLYLPMRVACCRCMRMRHFLLNVYALLASLVLYCIAG